MLSFISTFNVWKFQIWHRWLQILRYTVIKIEYKKVVVTIDIIVPSRESLVRTWVFRHLCANFNLNYWSIIIILRKIDNKNKNKGFFGEFIVSKFYLCEPDERMNLILVYGSWLNICTQNKVSQQICPVFLCYYPKLN